MKLLFLSDLHIDVNQQIKKENMVTPLIAFINKKQPDYVIIAGDITGSAEWSLEIIEKIQRETGVIVKFVPGNHDIWTDGESSWDAYQLLANHPSTLIQNPLEINDDTVVIGDMGWYDYSFKPSFMNPEEVALHKPNLWNDAIYAKWGMSDDELYEKMHQNFKTQIERYRDKRIIFVNHFLPYSDFLVFKSDLAWNTANAFMGSEKLGKLLDSYSNIEYIVFGHTHKRFGKMEFGDKTIICNPLGYTGEWKSPYFEKELEKIGVVIEI